MHSPRGRYNPLLNALDALPAAQPSVRFSFAALETLLGSPLPPIASIGTYWSSSRVARSNWQRSGFVARLDRAGPAVIFTRRPRPA